MKNLVIHKALDYSAKIYYKSNYGAPAMVISICISALLFFSCGISALEADMGEYSLAMEVLMNFFYSGNFWLALIISSIASFSVNFLFGTLLIKYVIKRKRGMITDPLYDAFQDGIVEWAQLSPFLVFGAGLIAPIYITIVTVVAALITPIVEFNPLTEKRLKVVSHKIIGSNLKRAESDSSDIEEFN